MLLLLSNLALAGTIYINGVDVGDLRSQTFENVTVTFDSQGNIHVSAPGYQIEVVDPTTGGTVASSTEGAATAATPGTTSTGATATAGTVGGSAFGAPVAGFTPSGLPVGRWWLVTEDSGSTGHSVDVFVNGALVKNIRSGGPQLIEDITAFLKPGTNDVRIQSMSTSAGGGSLYVYIGTGSNESGTLVMDAPTVQFGLGSSRVGSYERTYAIEATP